MSSLSCSNSSHDFITEDKWLLKGEEIVNGQLIAAVLILMVLIGLPSNTLVIVAIVRKQLYHQPTFILLLNLALIDVLLCMLVLPVNIISGFAGEFFFGDNDHTRCQVCQVGVIFTTLTFLSLYSMSLISLDRFLFIRRPLKYEQMLTVKRTVIIVLGTWLLCIVISILPIFGFGHIDFAKRTALCTVNCAGNIRYLLVLSGLSLLPLTVLIVTNVWLIVIVQKHIRQIYTTHDSCLSSTEKEIKLRNLVRRIKERRNQKQLHLVRVFGAIFATNICTWLPILVVTISCSALNMESVPLPFVTFSYLALVSQSVLHPILEASLVRDIRIYILRILCYCCHEKFSRYTTRSSEEATTNQVQADTKKTLADGHSGLSDTTKVSNGSDIVSNITQDEKDDSSFCECECIFLKVCSAAVVPE